VTPPLLETERLRLRPFAPPDAPEVQRLAGAREIADTTKRIPHPYGAGVAEAWDRHPRGAPRGESRADARDRAPGREASRGDRPAARRGERERGSRVLDSRRRVGTRLRHGSGPRRDRPRVRGTRPPPDLGRPLREESRFRARHGEAQNGARRGPAGARPKVGKVREPDRPRHPAARVGESPPTVAGSKRRGRGRDGSSAEGSAPAYNRAGKEVGGASEGRSAVPEEGLWARGISGASGARSIAAPTESAGAARRKRRARRGPRRRLADASAARLPDPAAARDAGRFRRPARRSPAKGVRSPFPALSPERVCRGRRRALPRFFGRESRPGARSKPVPVPRRRR